MSLIARAATVSSWTFCSRILGLFRDRILGSLFGAGTWLDAFFIAFMLPNLTRNLFGEGALSAAFLPRYVRCQEKGSEGPFAGAVITRLALLLLGLALLGMTGAWVLMSIDHPQTVMVGWLALPQMPFLIFICLSAVIAGILNSHNHFAVPAAAPVVLNVMMISMALLTGDLYALAWAITITGLIQLSMHLVAWRRLGPLPQASLASSPEVKDLRRALAPTLFSSGIYQLNTLMDSLIAFVVLSDRPGAVAVLFFANRLLQFPLALVGHAVATAAYPDIARSAKDGFSGTGPVLLKSTGLLLPLLLPASVGLIAVADPLVRTIYQVGAFNDEAAERTVAVVRFFALGVVPIALGKVFIRAFYAQLMQKIPVIVGLVAVGINLTLNIILVLTPLAEAGLALASAITSWGTALAYIFILRRYGSGIVVHRGSFLRSLLASLTMGIFAFAAVWYVPSDLLPGTAGHGLRLAAGVGVGALVYGALMLKPLLAVIRRRRG